MDVRQSNHVVAFRSFEVTADVSNVTTGVHDSHHENVRPMLLMPRTSPPHSHRQINLPSFFLAISGALRSDRWGGRVGSFRKKVETFDNVVPRLRHADFAIAKMAKDFHRNRFLIPIISSIVRHFILHI
jgi:hypothetical protein